MTARMHWDPEAGPWVAYRDEPTRASSRNPNPVTRHYLYDAATGVGVLGDPARCVRYSTRAEALAAARARWPRRVAGCRIGAERVAA